MKFLQKIIEHNLLYFSLRVVLYQMWIRFPRSRQKASLILFWTNQSFIFESQRTFFFFVKIDLSSLCVRDSLSLDWIHRQHYIFVVARLVTRPVPVKLRLFLCCMFWCSNPNLNLTFCFHFFFGFYFRFQFYSFSFGHCTTLASKIEIFEQS